MCSQINIGNKYTCKFIHCTIFPLLINEWAYGVAVSMTDFHQGWNPGQAVKFHNYNCYTKMPSFNSMCHPYEVGKWIPV